jgi:hypothetical protein
VPHLLRHGTSVYKFISERPVILTSECRVLGEGAITTYFKRLKFDATGTILMQIVTRLKLLELYNMLFQIFVNLATLVSNF